MCLLTILEIFDIKTQHWWLPGIKAVLLCKRTNVVFNNSLAQLSLDKLLVRVNNYLGGGGGL